MLSKVRFQGNLPLKFYLYLFSHFFEVHVQLLVTLVPCWRLLMVSWILDIKFFLFSYIKVFCPRKLSKPILSFHFLPYCNIYLHLFMRYIVHFNGVFIFQFSNLTIYVCMLLCCKSHLQPKQCWCKPWIIDQVSTLGKNTVYITGYLVYVYSKWCSVWRHNSSRDVSTVHIST